MKPCMVYASTVTSGSLAMSRTATLKERCLVYLDCRPWSDDEQVADALGEVPFAVSVALGELEDEGRIVGERP